MMVIRANNVNDAYAQAMSIIYEDNPNVWREISPRGGLATKEFHEPVATVYECPWRRVLFDLERDANPFFHFMESMWMLAGRQDAEWISQFSKNISNYAEEDGNFHGAYGYRWREYFGFDQVDLAVNQLRMSPDSRRVVLAQWDATGDLGVDRRDIPCNTHVYFKIRDKNLHMTVCCRSNDIVWGCYGANAVHFSFLQEFVAAGAGVGVGTYTHVSDSWHYYLDNPTIVSLFESGTMPRANYWGAAMNIPVTNPIHNYGDWWSDLCRFMKVDDWRDCSMYEEAFFGQVAVPMRDAWANYKRGDLETAMTRATDIRAADWRMACVNWLQKRINSRTETGVRNG